MKKIVLFLIIVMFFIADASYAIPAFARKYNMSCQTCHAPIPRLKAYGDEFAGNGFVLNDQDAPRYFTDTGDDELSLIRDFPLAVRMDAHVTYRDDDPAQGDFGTPYLVKLLSGGALSDNIAYYFYFYMNERGGVAGVEDAYLMYNNLFGTELDIYLGQFQVSDPLFKRELRLTLEDYLLYKQRIGIANANLAYDRGIMLTYGFDTGTDVIVEIINGNGLREADGDHRFDNNQFKNLVGRVSQDIGDNLRIGGFVYYGEEKLGNNFGLVADDKITYFGPDITLNFNDVFEINAQYLNRTDSDLFYSTSSVNSVQDVKTESMMMEFIYMPDGDYSKWYAVALANWIDSDYDAADYKSVSGHLGYMLRRNIRLVGEYRYDLLNEFGIASIGVVSAF
ncbi:MAG: hypothetical protein SCALA702_17380 [Melioribacteraceae bacterium]|nr:MAG: hypothetical protein SCALA702_17380 [Melioribacteraceae bacterium]